MKDHQIIVIIEQIIFSNSTTSFSVLKVREKKTAKIFCATGCIEKLFVNQEITLYGQWTKHAKYGEQFAFDQYNINISETIESIEAYLSSDIFKGIGPKTATKIANYFGKNAISILDDNINRLYEIESLDEKVIESIKDSWNQNMSYRNILLFLGRYGLPLSLAEKIYDEYGIRAVQEIKNNPYDLIETISYIGFIKADQIALKLGIAEDSLKRIKAAIIYVLKKFSDQGHSYMLIKQLEKTLLKLLNLNYPIKKAIEALEYEKTIILINADLTNVIGSKAISLAEHFFTETDIADHIIEMMNDESKLCHHSLENIIDEIVADIGFDLSEEQYSAVNGLLKRPISILTGGPGVGKTTTLKCLIKILESLKMSYYLAAPTGRAAQKMSEVIGQKAYTLHRLLEIDINNQSIKKLNKDILIIDEASMIDIFLMKIIVNAIKPGTQLILIGDQDQLPSVSVGNVLGDMIHSELIPVFLLNKIFRQVENGLIIHSAHKINHGEVPDIPLAHQSKTMKDMMFFETLEPNFTDIQLYQNFLKMKSVLKDDRSKALIKIENNSDVFEFFNKNSTPNIVKIDTQSSEMMKNNYACTFSLPRAFDSKKINELKHVKNHFEFYKLIHSIKNSHSLIKYGFFNSDLIVQLYIKMKSWKPNANLQVLSPMKKGSLGVINLNKCLQEKLNPQHANKCQMVFKDYILREGDKVMQIKNNYKLKVFNGDIGVIKSIDSSNKIIVIDYPTLSDSITYENQYFDELKLAYAITIHKSQGSEYDMVIMPIDVQSFIMLKRNLLYTAITRAKSNAFIVGTKKAFAIAVKSNDYNNRQTLLKSLLLIKRNKIS